MNAEKPNEVLLNVKMHIIENDVTKPEYNLALEEYLCRLTGRDGREFFMLWRNEPSVIVGRFQDVPAEVNVTFARAHNIPIIRRNSGGGAVYHDLGNVNYSFIMTESPGQGFASFAERMIRALSHLGAEAEFSLSRNDIAANGMKVSGMAQYRHKGVILCHGTLLFDCNLDVLSVILDVPDEKLRRHGVKSVRSRVANLKPFIPHAAGTEGFMELLRREFRENGTDLVLSAHDKDEIRKLAEGKYSAPSWNFEGRSDVPNGEDI